MGFSVYLKSLIALWKSYRLKLWLSIFCVAVAVFDTTVISLSPVAAGALFIAIVPWVLGYIERVAVPGGFEIVLKDTERKLDQSNALPAVHGINLRRDATEFTIKYGPKLLAQLR